MDKIIAIDIEASGFFGYPIEIGWAEIGAGNYESRLIRPDPTWDIHAAWGPAAEEIHGISLDKLMREGIPAFRVLAEFKLAIEGATLFSDAPSYDSRWLQHLYDLGNSSAQRIFPAPGFPPVESVHRAGPDALALSRFVTSSTELYGKLLMSFLRS